MKTRLLQILFANSFDGLDHEDPYTYLTKFYEIVGTLGASKDEEDEIFIRLFPYSLVENAKKLYLDQSTSTMTN